MNVGLHLNLEPLRQIPEEGRSWTIRCIALVRIDLEGRSFIDLDMMEGFVGACKIRVEGMCCICTDEQALRKSAAVALGIGSCKPCKDIAKERPLGTLMAFAADFLMIKQGNDLGLP